jgi:hypothetical protein
MECLTLQEVIKYRYHGNIRTELKVDMVCRPYSESGITPSTIAAGVLPEFCHLPTAISSLTQTLLHINGKKLVSLKPVVRTRRSYNRAGLVKQ